MASQYEDTKAEIIRSITAQKNIYKFRQFLYSLNRDIRQTCFRITKEYLENEYRNNTAVTVTRYSKYKGLPKPIMIDGKPEAPMSNQEYTLEYKKYLRNIAS